MNSMRNPTASATTSPLASSTQVTWCQKEGYVKAGFSQGKKKPLNHCVVKVNRKESNTASSS